MTVRPRHVWRQPVAGGNRRGKFHIFGSDPTVTITFINDAYAGPGKDRNLYVDGMTYNGVIQTATASLFNNSSQSFVLNNGVQASVTATLDAATETGLQTKSSKGALGSAETADTGNAVSDILRTASAAPGLFDHRVLTQSFVPGSWSADARAHVTDTVPGGFVMGTIADARAHVALLSPEVSAWRPTVGT